MPAPWVTVIGRSSTHMGRSHQLATSAVETSARPRDDPDAYSAEMAKAARLSSKRFRRPAATRIGELRYVREGAQHLILRPAIVLYVRDPHFLRYRQAAACPRAAQKTQTYRSLRFPAVAVLVPSAGTITFANRVAFGCGCPKQPASGAHARGARSHSSKGENPWKFVQSCGDPRSRVSCQGATASAVVTMIVG